MEAAHAQQVPNRSKRASREVAKRVCAMIRSAWHMFSRQRESRREQVDVARQKAQQAAE